MEAKETESTDGASPEAVVKTRKAAEKLLNLTDEAEKMYTEGERRQLVYLYRALAYRALDDQAGSFSRPAAFPPATPVPNRLKGMAFPALLI